MSPFARAVTMVASVAVLFAATLVLGVQTNRRARQPQLDGGKSGWLTSMSKLTAGLVPKLEGRQLWCNGQRLSDSATLTQAKAACEIRLPARADVEYRKASLEVTGAADGPAPAVYVRATYEERDFPLRARDRRNCFLDSEPLPHDFRLQIELTTADASFDAPWQCWLLREQSSAIAITVLEAGGRLQLQCVGCDDAAPARQVRVRIAP